MIKFVRLKTSRQFFSRNILYTVSIYHVVSHCLSTTSHITWSKIVSARRRLFVLNINWESRLTWEEACSSWENPVVHGRKLYSWCWTCCSAVCKDKSSKVDGQGSVMPGGSFIVLGSISTGFIWANCSLHQFFCSKRLGYTPSHLYS